MSAPQHQHFQVKESTTSQMSEVTTSKSTQLITRNKAAALEVLLRVQQSLRMETASQVFKTTISVRTEEM